MLDRSQRTTEMKLLGYEAFIQKRYYIILLLFFWTCSNELTVDKVVVLAAVQKHGNV